MSRQSGGTQQNFRCCTLTMATSEPQKLPFDAVLSILDRITDKNSLYECARTCRSFHEAVIPNLYKSISVVVARYHKSLPQLGPFKAIETHPYLRQYVKSVEISLGLYDYNMHRDRLVPLWKALSHLSNITSFTLKHPEDTYFHLPGILTASIVSALAGCEKLERLTVLSAISAISIERFSSLKTVKAVRFGHLLSSQTLNALGKWFRQAEGGFHTLGILIAHAVGAGDIDQLTPYVSSLHTLHIGRNHGLPPRDLLSLLVHTPRLQFLDVTYYGPQPLGLVERGSGYLNQLQNLAVRYYGFSDLSSSHDFHHWIEYVASSSPLKSFSLISNDRRKYELARELLSILYTKTELEVLNIPDVLLGRSELGTLLGTFKKLRVLSLFLPDINLLVRFSQVPRPHKRSSAHPLAGVLSFIQIKRPAAYINYRDIPASPKNC
ncbi:hypothetical protein E1B28_013373 [Marasmius oreades]|uniref:F-box domain-containing protein n=1 Tax=Marasmius oreades TaxID=181124 RepID=A0A9P7RQV0_9AGAR|nr:uncharacterized protein E1B28_013373 [Marasmius oreades]KAG7087403.1 hypothetical protein E1B28_013373 [Marasmius oreades]